MFVAEKMSDKVPCLLKTLPVSMDEPASVSSDTMVNGDGYIKLNSSSDDS